MALVVSIYELILSINSSVPLNNFSLSILICKACESMNSSSEFL